MAIIKLHQNRINPLVLPVIFAKELGLFKKHGVDVDLRLAEDFIFQGREEFLNQEVDAIMGDTTFFFNYLKAEKEVMITSTLTRTIQIVKHKNSLISDLNLGINQSGLFRFFRDTYLQTPLKNAHYVLINNTYERIEAMKKGEINGLVAIDPFIGKVLREQEAEVYWHSKQIPGIFVMWCFDAAFVRKFPEEVRHFHQALEEAAQLYNSWTPAKRIEQCCRLANYTEQAANEFATFTFEPQKNYSPEDFDLLQDWLIKNQELKQRFLAKDYIFETF